MFFSFFNALIKLVVFAGIVDQPGFPSGSNYLHPWDMKVKVKSKKEWAAVANSFSRKGKTAKLDFGTANDKFMTHSVRLMTNF